MAIEAMNNIMSLQATQTNANIAPKPAMEYTDVSIAENSAPKVDKSTKVVENAEQKDSDLSRDSQKESSNEVLHNAVENLNKKMSNSEAIFGIHEGTNRVTIKIVDKKTKEVIKELPPEKTLDMIAKVWEMAGLLVDEKR
ncbi:MAG: flagellar protein FlaG [Lachnospiraceae bacterium]|nr:flagellar protein FlaG [Lachnospiraceae bacterium]